MLFGNLLSAPSFAEFDNSLEQISDKQTQKDTNKILVPDWIKNNARWWSQGHLTDDDFLKGIQYLIKEEILNVSQTNNVQDTVNSNVIPLWVKNTTKFWVEDKVDDKTFLNSLEFLISNGILQIPNDEYENLKQTYEHPQNIKPAQPKVTTYSKYQNESHGFSISYPTHWEISEINSNEIVFVPKDIMINSFEYMSINQNNVVDSNKTFEMFSAVNSDARTKYIIKNEMTAFMEEKIKNDSKFGTQIKIDFSSTEIKHNLITMDIRFSSIIKNGEELIPTKQIFLVKIDKTGNGYGIYLVSTPDRFEKNSYMYDELLSSFQIIK